MNDECLLFMVCNPLEEAQNTISEGGFLNIITSAKVNKYSNYYFILQYYYFFLNF